MRTTKLWALAATAAAMLVLAGCGGSSTSQAPAGGGSKTTAQLVDDATQALDAAKIAVNMVMDDSEEAKVTDAEKKVKAAEDAVMKVPAAQRADLKQRLGELQGRLREKSDHRMTAMQKADMEMKQAMVATGKALFAAMTKPDGDDKTVLDNLESDPVYNDRLVDDATYDDGARKAVRAKNYLDRPRGDFRIDPAAGAGSRATSDLHGAVSFRHGTEEAKDAEEKVDGVWTVTDYERTQGTGEAKFTDKVKVYSNRTGPHSVPAAKWFSDAEAKNNFTSNAGDYNAKERRISLNTGIDHSIDSPEFPETGTLNFPPKDGAEEIKVRGTYRGAPGYYYCTPGTGTCDVGVGTGGYFLQTTGNADWTFVHDEGAMVTHPDYHFAYFGWWVREDDDGMPAAVAPFYAIGGEVVTSPNGYDLLGGEATFEGPAVGQYAIHDPLNNKGEGGAFTAMALLKAKFGATTNVPDTGMTGTVDRFRLEDGSEPNWSVTLNRGSGTKGGWDTNGGGKTVSAKTVWSIGGVKAEAAGSWVATMYDETPGLPTTASAGITKPVGDGNSDPTLVLGKFHAEHGGTHRMVGAFGAKRKEPSE